jgi:hypothetical protein
MLKDLPTGLGPLPGQIQRAEGSTLCPVNGHSRRRPGCSPAEPYPPHEYPYSITNKYQKASFNRPWKQNLCCVHYPVEKADISVLVFQLSICYAVPGGHN